MISTKRDTLKLGLGRKYGRPYHRHHVCRHCLPTKVPEHRELELHRLGVFYMAVLIGLTDMAEGITEFIAIAIGMILSAVGEKEAHKAAVVEENYLY